MQQRCQIRDPKSKDRRSEEKIRGTVDDRPPKAGKLRWDEGRWKKGVGSRQNNSVSRHSTLCPMRYALCLQTWKLETGTAEPRTLNTEHFLVIG